MCIVPTLGGRLISMEFRCSSLLYLGQIASSTFFFFFSFYPYVIYSLPAIYLNSTFSIRSRISEHSGELKLTWKGNMKFNQIIISANSSPHSKGSNTSLLSLMVASGYLMRGNCVARYSSSIIVGYIGARNFHEKLFKIFFFFFFFYAVLVIQGRK